MVFCYTVQTDKHIYDCWTEGPVTSWHSACPTGGGGALSEAAIRWRITGTFRNGNWRRSCKCPGARGEASVRKLQHLLELCGSRWGFSVEQFRCMVLMPSPGCLASHGGPAPRKSENHLCINYSSASVRVHFCCLQPRTLTAHSKLDPDMRIRMCQCHLPL